MSQSDASADSEADPAATPGDAVPGDPNPDGLGDPGGPGARSWQRLGTVVLAATPIGSAGDATANLRALLAQADVIAAEDTRTLRTLLHRIGVTPSGTLVSYHDHNERERAGELVRRAGEGATVAVVSNAGMPTVSDPGYRVAAAAHEAGVPVTALPGPSAVLTALAVSGLATDRFCFEGFLPRKQGERLRVLREVSDERRTMVYFSSPHRLAAELADAADALGPDRPAAVCRELTKRHEEVRRGGLAELATWAGEGVRGEITLVIAGAEPVAASTPEEAAAEAITLAEGGLRLKDAAAQVAERTGLGKRAIYEAALALRE